ncbi:MAG TPA: von Willebrand factor type A domain-containing protein, partial [Polyangiaceae bacterium]|nr:von Willebrand factor type A domain-containing protein [Polyangiaceae bacterium]
MSGILEKFTRCNSGARWSMALLLASLGACAESDRDVGTSVERASVDSGDSVQPREASSLAPRGPAPATGQPAAQSPSLGAAGGASSAPVVAPAPSGDDFDAPGTNPFVMADYDPLSTFAVDVDTASYDVFRRDIEDGVLPNPASVRLEEYVNYFSYDYPAAGADAEVPFSISLAAAPSPLAAELTLLRVGIQGKLPPPEEKRPANLVFLVDVSGS